MKRAMAKSSSSFRWWQHNCSNSISFCKIINKQITVNNSAPVTRHYAVIISSHTVHVQWIWYKIVLLCLSPFNIVEYVNEPVDFLWECVCDIRFVAEQSFAFHWSLHWASTESFEIKRFFGDHQLRSVAQSSIIHTHLSLKRKLQVKIN